MEFIDKIGIEIEGGWDKNRTDLEEDVGIRMGDFFKSACCGELVSKPFSSPDEIIEYMKENWPTETQRMCGFHIHMSFKDISHYCALMNRKFQDYFYQCMDSWGRSYPVQNEHFWERIENKNKFCKKEYRADEQILLTKKVHNHNGRYTAIHYAYGLHKTLEIRLLPTFVSVDTAIGGFLAVINCIESFLKENPPESFDFDVESSLSEEDVQNETLNRKEIKINSFNFFAEKGLVRHGRIPTIHELNEEIKKAPKPPIDKNGKALKPKFNKFVYSGNYDSSDKMAKMSPASISFENIFATKAVVEEEAFNNLNNLKYYVFNPSSSQ